MSQIRLYAPVLDEEHEPAVIPFSRQRLPLNPSGSGPCAARARLRWLNQVCPCCGRITVEPIELEDALLNRKDEPIPGTATVVGFCCETCGAQWPAVTSEAR